MRYSRGYLALLLKGSVLRVEAAISPPMQDTNPTIYFLVNDATFFERHVWSISLSSGTQESQVASSWVPQGCSHVWESCSTIFNLFLFYFSLLRGCSMPPMAGGNRGGFFTACLDKPPRSMSRIVGFLHTLPQHNICTPCTRRPATGHATILFGRGTPPADRCLRSACTRYNTPDCAAYRSLV
jgi:hypothetical protein